MTVSAGLPAELFENPVWHALTTRHAHLAQPRGNAVRYRPDVAPFAALAVPSARTLADLHSLLAPGEWAWVFGTAPAATELQPLGLRVLETLACLQMWLPPQAAAPPGSDDIEPLSDPAEMVALTDIAFPGFFRNRTCEMGVYYGIRANGKLIAMAGERLLLPGHSELSAICVHPEHRRRGHAAHLVGELVREHRTAAIVSFLHVSASNRGAIETYRRLGFETAREVMLYRLGTLQPAR